jgi:hypothetical protein
MAVPPTAKKLGKTLDPSDIKDIVINFAPMLQADEQIASYTIDLSTTSIAAGMEFLSGGGRDPALINDATALRLWPAIDETDADDPMFEPPGVALDFLITVITTSTPSRTDQQTFLIQWAQK